MSYWVGRTLQLKKMTIASDVDFMPEQDSKNLLMRILHDVSTDKGKIKLGLNWKLSLIPLDGNSSALRF